MTPSMKRLCEAARKAYYDSEDYGLNGNGPEVIVRAVLMALKDPFAGLYRHGAVDLVEGGNDGERHVRVDEGMAHASITSMINHILADPAETASK